MVDDEVADAVSLFFVPDVCFAGDDDDVLAALFEDFPDSIAMYDVVAFSGGGKRKERMIRKDDDPIKRSRSEVLLQPRELCLGDAAAITATSGAGMFDGVLLALEILFELGYQLSV